VTTVTKLSPQSQDLLPPFAEKSEAAALGCLLTDSHLAWPEFDRIGVDPSFFYDGRHVELFRIASDLRAEGLGVDTVLVCDRLLRAGGSNDRIQPVTQDKVTYAAALPDSVTSLAMLGSYLQELHETKQRRDYLRAAIQLKQLAEDAHTPIEKVSEAAEWVSNLNSGRSDRDDLPPIVSASDFMVEELPDSPEVIGGVLHQTAKLVLSGASKAGKTWLFIYLAVCVSVGAKWLGLDTSQGKVLYLNTELSRRTFQKRLRYVCSALGIPVSSLQLDLWHLRGKTAPWNVIIPKIRERIKDAGYTLIILDPLYRLYGALKENSAEDMGILTSALGDLSEQSGAAVAIATHHAKGNAAAKESIDRISGSGVIARDADALIDFTANEVEDAFSVALRLRDFKPMPDFGVRWSFPLFRRDENIDPSKLKQAAGRPRRIDPHAVLSAIADRTVENPVSISEWAVLSGTKRTTLLEYIPSFRQKRWVATVGEGMKSRQYITEAGICAVNQGNRNEQS
jgi:AAA domain-containing protein/DnaB helicase-like protein